MKLTDPSVIRSLLGEEDTSFKKKFGQNFLINASVVERIAASCAETCNEHGEKLGVLEIGPGIGTLTNELAQVAAKVVAVEIDDTLIPILSKTLAEYTNVTVVHNDVMKTDLSALVAEHFGDCDRIAVCANLPYYITTPILMALLESKLPFSTITVMIQKEVAERLTAKAGDGEYGAITATLSYYGSVKRLFTVHAGSFMPAPKVDSAVIQIELYKEPPVKVISEKMLFRVIKAAFGQRRKTLVNALSTAFPNRSKAELTELIVSCGFPATVRGEVLSIEAFAMLADKLT